MDATEVRIPDDDDLSKKLMDMRAWFDVHRYEPSMFRYLFDYPGMAIHVSFESADQAEAFAQRFDGSVLDSRGAADPQPGEERFTREKPQGAKPRKTRRPFEETFPSLFVVGSPYHGKRTRSGRRGGQKMSSLELNCVRAVRRR